jgi:hypothetical protein
MQLLSAHAAFGLFAALLIFILLLAMGLHPILALVLAGVGGPLLTGVLLKDLADRVERWLTTPK